MTTAQKKIVLNCFLAALLLLALLISNNWILNHWEILKWPVFAVLLIAGALTKNKPTHAERHFALNRIIEENPWIKIFYIAYGIAIAIGDYYAISNHIDLLKEGDSFLLLSAILLLFLPIFIVKVKKAYIEAGL